MAEFTKRQISASLVVPLLPALYFSSLPSYFSLVPKCPTCGKPVEWQDNPWRPFCSQRCKLIDFGRWIDEEYRVPAPQTGPSEIPPTEATEADDQLESES